MSEDESDLLESESFSEICYECTKKCRSKSCGKLIWQKIAEATNQAELVSAIKNYCLNPLQKRDNYDRSILDICVSMGNNDILHDIFELVGLVCKLNIDEAGPSNLNNNVNVNSSATTTVTTPDEINLSKINKLLYNSDLENGYSPFHLCLHYGKISTLVELLKILYFKPGIYFLNNKNLKDHEKFTVSDLLLTYFYEMNLKMERSVDYWSKRIRDKHTLALSSACFGSDLEPTTSTKIKFFGNYPDIYNINEISNQSKFYKFFNNFTASPNHIVLYQQTGKYITNIATLGTGIKRLGTGKGLGWVKILERYKKVKIFQSI